jgi:hypothetical protein
MFKDQTQIREAVIDIRKTADLFDGSNYGQGIIEDMQGTIENLALFCGSLVKMLIEKKVLTIEEAEELFSIRS